MEAPPHMPTHDPYSVIGEPVSRAATPCLVIDRPRLRANLAAMQRVVEGHGKALRPHAKTHKCTPLARLQLEGGAIGICAAKLSEAEALVRSGIRNVLLTGPVVTPGGHHRLVEARRADPGLTITLDSPDNARAINHALGAAGLRLRCLIDLDIGQQRTGIAPADLTPFARELARMPALEVCGVQAYAGHAQHIGPYDQRRRVNHEAVARACEAMRQARADGLDLPALSVGGTGSHAFDVLAPEVTEIQAGSYVFMDAEYAAIEHGAGSDAPSAFETALTLHTTVMSDLHRVSGGFVTADAGLKSMYRDGAVPQVVSPGGQGLVYDWFGDEYGRIACEPTSAAGPALSVGDRLALRVSHCDPTVNLFDFYHVVEDGVVCEVWPIDLRGCSQ